MGGICGNISKQKQQKEYLDRNMNQHQIDNQTQNKKTQQDNSPNRQNSKINLNDALQPQPLSQRNKEQNSNSDSLVTAIATIHPGQVQIQPIMPIQKKKTSKQQIQNKQKQQQQTLKSSNFNLDSIFMQSGCDDSECINQSIMSAMSEYQKLGSDQNSNAFSSSQEWNKLTVRYWGKEDNIDPIGKQYVQHDWIESCEAILNLAQRNWNQELMQIHNEDFKILQIAIWTAILQSKQPFSVPNEFTLQKQSKKIFEDTKQNLPQQQQREFLKDTQQQFGLPEISAKEWTSGFIWKAVYLKLLSVKESCAIKRELRCLGQLFAEYIIEDVSFIQFQPSQAQSKKRTNIILPIVGLIQNCSCCLFALPIFNATASESLNQQQTDKIDNIIQELKQFKLFSKLTAQNFMQQSMTNDHNHDYNNLQVQNVFQAMKSQYSINTMFTISQEKLTDEIRFLEIPKPKEIDFTQVIQLMNLKQQTPKILELELKKLMNNNYNLDQNNLLDKNSLLDKNNVSKFVMSTINIDKWEFKMLHLKAEEGQTNLNIRATELVRSSQDPQQEHKSATIFGNVFTVGRFTGSAHFKPVDENIQRANSLDQVIAILESQEICLTLINVKEILNKYHLPCHYIWNLMQKAPNQKTQNTLACIILCKTMKKMIYTFMHQLQKRQCSPELTKQFYSGTVFKMYLVYCLNQILRPEVSTVPPSFENAYNSYGLPAMQSQQPKSFYRDLLFQLNLSRMRCIGYQHFLNNKENKNSYFLSNLFLKDLIVSSALDAVKFISIVESTFAISFSTKFKNKIQQNPSIFVTQVADECIQLSDVQTLKNQHFTYQGTPQRAEVALSKLLTSNNDDHQQKQYFDKQWEGVLQAKDLSIVRDWLQYIEMQYIKIKSFDDSLIQLLLSVNMALLQQAYFVENSYTKSRKHLDTIFKLLESSTETSRAEFWIMAYFFKGMLSEHDFDSNDNIKEHQVQLESQQNYIIAIILIHEVYGDPMLRGCERAVAIEVFILWRLYLIFCANDAAIASLTEIDLLLQATLLEQSSKNIYNQEKIPNQNLFLQFGFQKQQQDIINAKQFFFLDKTQSILLQFQNLNLNQKMQIVQQSLKENESGNEKQRLYEWICSNTLAQNKYYSDIYWNSSLVRQFYSTCSQDMMQYLQLISSDMQENNQINKAEQNSGTKAAKVSTSPILAIKFPKKDTQGGKQGVLNTIIGKYSQQSEINDISRQGVIYSWGNNNFGQLGQTAICNEMQSIKLKTHQFDISLMVQLKNYTLKKVACGSFHCLALSEDGHLFAWGDNRYQQLGLGVQCKELSSISQPQLIQHLNGITQISCGSQHNLAFDNQLNLVYAWGQGEGGLLGVPATLNTQQSDPQIIPTLKNYNIFNIVCGGLHSLAITKDNKVLVWGRGEGGQLGLPLSELTLDKQTNELYLHFPKEITELISEKVIQVAAGDAHSLALTESGEVFCWGYTNSGQLGLGIFDDMNEKSSMDQLQHQVMKPIKNEYLKANFKIKAVYAGSTFSFFHTQEGDILGTGLNDCCQLGLKATGLQDSKFSSRKMSQNLNQKNDEQSEIWTPVKLPLLTQNAQKIVCGENHSLVYVKIDQTKSDLYSWGMNKQGQLGLGENMKDRSYCQPTAIPIFKNCNILSMGCGSNFSIAVTGAPITQNKTLILRTRNEIISKSDTNWSCMTSNIEDTIKFNLDQEILSQKQYLN